MNPKLVNFFLIKFLTNFMFSGLAILIVMILRLIQAYTVGNILIFSFVVVFTVVSLAIALGETRRLMRSGDVQQVVIEKLTKLQIVIGVLSYSLLIGIVIYNLLNTND